MAKFKTRARAVDMLGRQQIAGVPNAISELFKNAHDAYADNVVVDFFRSDGLFVLRDDGLGMTQDDFENRWLTIGTESKLVSSKGIKQPPIDSSKKKRPIMGEKGIGRLAIAVIGPQVLVLTRARRGNKLSDLVAAFLHWGLFEAPGVNLDQIDIPIAVFPGGTLPTAKEVGLMVSSVRNNVLNLQKDGYLDGKFARRLLTDLENFHLDLSELTGALKTPSLLDDGCGTHFYIMPSNESLVSDLDMDIEGKEASKLRKLLLGFSNTMLPDTKPPVSTAFRYWRTNEQSYDLISEEEFFTPEDFKAIDHYIEGTFDENGQFSGTVSIYGKKKFKHVIPWTKGIGTPISCGSFKIKFGYVQGDRKDTKVPPEDWAMITRKLNLIGGLYIYQDDIRILPYGDYDVDYLGIEKRRSMGIGYYFFSYRRMFGAIELTRAQNSNLVEKAGREGFQENKAFHEFKAVLENFFIQLAADFFREDGKYSDVWIETREEIKRIAQARQRQEKESKKKQREFEIQINTFFEKVKAGLAEKDVIIILDALREQISVATENKDQIALLEAEVNATRELNKVRAKFRIEKPRGIGLTRQLKRDWNAYGLEIERLEKDVFVSTQEKIDSIVNDAIKDLKFALDQKQRVDLLVNDVVVDARNLIQNKIVATREKLVDLDKRFNVLVREISEELEKTVSHIESEVNETDFSDKRKNEIEEYRHRWENQISTQSQKYSEILTHVQAQFENINWYRDEYGYLIGGAEITAALEDEVLALRERADADLELTQLGMALDVVNHEFTNIIRSIRNNLRKLKAWAEANPKLQSVYKDIFDSFAHLDGYLTLFTPLNRRLYRTSINMSGSNIATYLEDLFNERLERHEVTLIVTDTFRRMELVGYPSTFYPVFINLVDNAIFWLKDHSLPREIKLDANGVEFFVSDNGPGISNRDREAIFELGFTRKPGGRGMGLYISREVLKKENFQLRLLDKKGKKDGATFIISPTEIRY
ncbi:MAG TPA: ATP-binding protein [Flavobacteriales bacterium]|nr:ATP-binding protein [Flavobacteriales bacterium]